MVEDSVAPPCPWLALEYGENQQVLCDAVFDSAPRIARSIPKRRQFGTTNQAGWFLTGSDSEPVQLSLWNAVSLKSIALPLLDPKFVGSIRFVLLTETPSHPDCVVLLWVDYGIVFSHVNVAANGYGWTHRDYLEQLTQLTPPGEQMHDFKVAFVCNNKSIYMISDDGHFLFTRIEIVEPKTLVITPLTCNKPQITSELGRASMLTASHWVSCSDDLFSIRVTFGGVSHKDGGNGPGEEITSVTILKLDFSDMSWNIVDHNCYNVAFFLSGSPQNPSFSAYPSKAGNRLFMLVDATWLYTYHIQENTLHKTPLASLLPGPHFGPPLYPYWAIISDHLPLEKAGEVYHYSGSNGEEKEDELIVKASDDETSLVDLPADMLKAISCCLNKRVHYLSFRAASKSLSSALSPKGWSVRSATRSEGSASPWLIIPSLVDSGVTSAMNPVSNSEHLLRTWGDYGSRIAHSSWGWLLIQSSPFKEEAGKAALRLYNPMTESTVSIPQPPQFSDHYFIIYINDSWFVLGMSLSRPGLFFTKVGGDDVDDQWYGGEREDVASLHVSQSNINPVWMYGDCFYFFAGEENLAKIICSRDGFSFENHHFTSPCTSSYEQRFLVDFRNHLTSVYIGSDWLRVFVLVEDDMVWHELDHLNECTIYVSSALCMMRHPLVAEMRNRVYLPRFHRGFIVYYSFDTRKFHAGEGDSSEVSYGDTKEQLQSCWFDPRWQ